MLRLYEEYGNLLYLVYKVDLRNCHNFKKFCKLINLNVFIYEIVNL